MMKPTYKYYECYVENLNAARKNVQTALQMLEKIQRESDEYSVDMEIDATQRSLSHVNNTLQLLQQCQLIADFVEGQDGM